MQPVSVLDVAAAVLTAVRDDGAAQGQTFTLGGPDVFTYKQVVSAPLCAPPPPVRLLSRAAALWPWLARALARC